MEQRDYLMRQIEQAGRVLGKLLADLTGLKNQGKVREGIEQTGQTLQSELDLSIEEMMGVPVDGLIDTLKEKKQLFPDNFEKLADLLTEIAEGYQQENNRDASTALFQRALVLYEYVDASGSAFSLERYSKIEKIKDLLQDKQSL